MVPGRGLFECHFSNIYLKGVKNTPNPSPVSDKIRIPILKLRNNTADQSSGTLRTDTVADSIAIISMLSESIFFLSL